jgi:hypothetical protein
MTPGANHLACRQYNVMIIMGVVTMNFGALRWQALPWRSGRTGDDAIIEVAA